jgi:hypothetical protein
VGLSSTVLRIRYLVSAAAALLACGLLLAARAEPSPTAKPGCPLRIEVFEDASALLYCAKVPDPIGHIDAESGRVRLEPTFR